jgi:hypothetical protein
LENRWPFACDYAGDRGGSIAEPDAVSLKGARRRLSETAKVDEVDPVDVVDLL